MFVLILGIIVFLGIHSVPIFHRTRAHLIERIGLGPFKIVYSLVALIGFGLIVWGFHLYRAEGLIAVWTPPTWMRHVTILLMWFAFVALACMNPSHVNASYERRVPNLLRNCWCALGEAV